MSAPATANQSRIYSAFARREQSLLRSFSAIHRASVNSTVSHSSPVNRNGDDSLKMDWRGNAIRNSTQEGRRPCTLDTNSVSLSGPNTAINSRTDYAVSVLSFPSSDASSRQRSYQPHQESSRDCSSSKKIQRPHAPDTTHVAQEMVAKLAMAKQYERRNTSLVRTTDKDCVVNARQHRVPATSKDREAEAKPQYIGFRRDYSIGETIRSPSHMIIPHTASEQEAILEVGSLNMHDFAFVKRSNGSYSYAVLAYRSWEPIKGSNNTNEECMVFVMNKDGSTKGVRQRYWSEFVRHVSTEGLHLQRVTSSRRKTYVAHNDPPSSTQHLRISLGRLHLEIQSPELCTEIEREGDDVPFMIFVPQIDDECSLISSVSERVRLVTRSG